MTATPIQRARAVAFFDFIIDELNNQDRDMTVCHCGNFKTTEDGSLCNGCAARLQTRVKPADDYCGTTDCAIIALEYMAKHIKRGMR